jgi:uncharacterized protein involved in exopolysaccharide biosynthesis
MKIKQKRMKRIYFDNSGGVDKIYKGILPNDRKEIGSAKQIIRSSENIDNIRRKYHESSKVPFIDYSELYLNKAKQGVVRLTHTNF